MDAGQAGPQYLLHRGALPLRAEENRFAAHLFMQSLQKAHGRRRIPHLVGEGAAAAEVQPDDRFARIDPESRQHLIGVSAVALADLDGVLLAVPGELDAVEDHLLVCLPVALELQVVVEAELEGVFRFGVERIDRPERAEAEAELFGGVGPHGDRGRARGLVEAEHEVEALHAQRLERLGGIRRNDVNERIAAQHRLGLRMDQPRDMAGIVLLAERPEDRGRARGVTDSVKLNNKDARAHRLVVRATVATTGEPAGLVTPKEATVEPKVHPCLHQKRESSNARCAVRYRPGDQR